MKSEQNDPIEVPVEPLSEARWARIERGVFEALDDQAPPESRAPKPRRGAWWWAAAAAAVAVIASVLVVRLRAPTTTPPAVVAVTHPSRIVTGAGESHLALGENALDVGPDSAVVVSGDDAHGVLVVLDRGSVACQVSPRAGRPPFVVQAGAVRVRVIGTRFRVARLDESARVEVTEGVVEVNSGAETFLVPAGEVWPKTVVVPSTATLPQPSLALTAPEPTSKPAPTTSPSAKPVVASASASSAAPSATTATPQELYESAARLEAKDPAKAIALYRQVEVGGGPWAANALYAHGRLEAERGNRAEAKRLLEDYGKRFPKGPNAADCRSLLLQLK